MTSPDTQPRTLADFGYLTLAERKVLAELDTGEFIDLGVRVDDDGNRLPPQEGDTREEIRLRARFVRWLALGCAGSDHHLHEKGLRIAGALITGEGSDYSDHQTLDLQGVELMRQLSLAFTRFASPPILADARILGLRIVGSWLPGLTADGMIARTLVSIKGTQSSGELRFLGAKFGSHLSLDRAAVESAKRPALNLDGAEISGSLYLRQARISGEVRLLGTVVRGSLGCVGTKLKNRDGPTLNAGGASIGGAFFWREGATADGVIDLTSADINTIADHLDC